jgi:hypothetical protein
MLELGPRHRDDRAVVRTADDSDRMLVLTGVTEIVPKIRDREALGLFDQAARAPALSTTIHWKFRVHGRITSAIDERTPKTPTHGYNGTGSHGRDDTDAGNLRYRME